MTGRDMPPGMQQLMADKLIRQMKTVPVAESAEKNTLPCDNCLRWFECNGIDMENCPLCSGRRNVG